MANGKIDSYAKIKRADYPQIMLSGQYHEKYYADVNLVYPDNGDYHLISLYLYGTEQNLPATVQYIGYGQFRVYSDFQITVKVRAVFALSQ